MNSHGLNRRLPLSKAFNLVVKRKLIPGYQVGVYSKGQFDDRDGVINKGDRLLFMSTWHNRSLIGTEHLPYDDDPDSFAVTEEGIQFFNEKINEAYPAAGLKREDVSTVYGGLVPGDSDTGGEVQPTKRYRIRDHRNEVGVDGLISMVGVKFTESRHVAERAIRLVLRKLGKSPTKTTPAVTSLHGGQMADFEAYVDQDIARWAKGLCVENIRHLFYRYGTEYHEVRALLDAEPQPAQGSLEASRLLKAEVLHPVRNEKAQKLTDVVLRRTGLIIGGRPNQKALDHAPT